MKQIIFLMVVLVTSSCRLYKNEEIRAINDITSDYLLKNHLPEIRNEYNFFHPIQNPYIDTLNLKVYISSGLLPIIQIKEDNERLFSDLLKFGHFDSIYNSLINSKRFKKLNYCNINKSKLMLKRPYLLVNNLKNDLKEHEGYVKIFFSRICFDKKYKYGLLYLDYNSCHDNGSSGKVELLLIQKVKNKWVEIEKF